MTITSEQTKSEVYEGNGLQTIFEFYFRVEEAEHLKVLLLDADGVTHTLAITADYSIEGLGEDDGGNVDLLTAPEDGEFIVLSREVPIVQQTVLENQGSYFAKTVEAAFDYAIMCIQQIAEDFGRSLKLSIFDPNPIGPIPIDRAGRVMAFDDNGDPVNSILAADIEQAAAASVYADAAEASAEAADISEANALASAFAADASADAAAVSQGAAATSAGSALASASAADISEANALGYALAADASADAADVSEANALGYSIAADASADAADISEANALAYSLAADASADAASDSEDAAAISAAAAAASAGSVDTAFLLDRANHTGTEDIADVNGLQAALDAKVDESTINQANGVAGLDSGGLIPASLLPAYVDDVLEYANFAALPGTGVTGKIYVTTNDNKTFRWSGTVYVEISASPGSTDSVTEGSTNLYFTVARVRATALAGLSLASSAAITAASTVLSALGQLQAQVSLKADAASAALTGTPTAPTAAKSTNTTQVATAAFVDRAAKETTTRSVAGTTDTLVLADKGGTVKFTSGSATAVTVPPNSSVAFPVDTYINLEAWGAGVVTVTAGAGVTIQNANGLKLAKQYSMVTLRKDATDVWILGGDTTT